MVSHCAFNGHISKLEIEPQPRTQYTVKLKLYVDVQKDTHTDTHHRHMSHTPILTLLVLPIQHNCLKLHHMRVK